MLTNNDNKVDNTDDKGLTGLSSLTQSNTTVIPCDD